MTIPYPKSPLRWLHPHDASSAVDAYRAWTSAQCARWSINHGALEHCERHLQQLNAIINAQRRKQEFLSMCEHLTELSTAVMHGAGDRASNHSPIPAVFHAAGEITFRWSEACALDPAMVSRMDNLGMRADALPHIACENFEIAFGFLQILRESLGDPAAWWSEDAEHRALSRAISIFQQDTILRMLHLLQIIMSNEVAASTEKGRDDGLGDADDSLVHINAYRAVQTHLGARTTETVRAALARAGRFCHFAFRDRMNAYRYGAVATAVAFYLGEWNVAEGYARATPAYADLESNEYEALESDIKRTTAIRVLCAAIPR